MQSLNLPQSIIKQFPPKFTLLVERKTGQWYLRLYQFGRIIPDSASVLVNVGGDIDYKNQFRGTVDELNRAARKILGLFVKEACLSKSFWVGEVPGAGVMDESVQLEFFPYEGTYSLRLYHNEKLVVDPSPVLVAGPMSPYQQGASVWPGGKEETVKLCLKILESTLFRMEHNPSTAFGPSC